MASGASLRTKWVRRYGRIPGNATAFVNDAEGQLSSVFEEFFFEGTKHNYLDATLDNATLSAAGTVSGDPIFEFVGRYAESSTLAVGGGFVGITLNALVDGIDTHPSQGDLIVVGLAIGSQENVGLSASSIRNQAGTVNYTAPTSAIYANDSFDASLLVGYAFAGATPDSSVTIQPGAFAHVAYTMMIEVWRGVDPTTPLDVSVVTSSGTNTGLPDPGAITPADTRSKILCFAVGASTDASTPAALTATGFSSYDTVQQQGGTNRASTSTLWGHLDWSSPGVDLPLFGGGSNTTSDSWAAMMLALRPAPPPTSGALSVTLADATLAADGTVAYGTISGAAAITLDAATLAAEGAVLDLGALGATLEPATLSSAGTVLLVGSLTATLGDVTLSAAGTVPALGTLSATLSDLSVDAAGTVLVAGALSGSLDAVTLVATGETADGVLAGTLNVTLDDAAISSVGVVPIVGSLSGALDGLSISSDGLVAVKGALSVTLGALTGSGAGVSPIIGSVTATLADLSLAAAGAVADIPFSSAAGLTTPAYNTLLVEIAPLDPADGTRKTIRATNVNDHRVTGLNSLIWRPAISENARLSIRLFKGDFDGSAAPAGGNISLRLDQLVPQQADVRRFVWPGSTVKIWSGRAGDTWPWDQVFEGIIGGNPRAERNGITLPLEVNAEPFNADILTEKYAGTGDEEGGADLKDKPKPWLLGRCFNVEPVLINATDSVFQFSAYGAIEAVTKLYERGSDFGASYGDYANYAALVAADIPAGRWGTCLAEGMVRLGAPPVGVITGDVDGDKYGGTWRRKTGEIITRVATNAGAGSLLDATSLSNLDTSVAAVATVNQGRIGVYLTDQETLLEFASRLASPCNAQAGISLLGQLFVSRVAIDTATITLDAQQRQMPRVTKSIEIGTRPPFSKIEMGYARSWRVHSTDEIAYYADLVDRGRYDNTAFYREGNMVDLEDGSRWVYINPVPASGNPPPTWPTTSNSHWDNLSPPLRFQVDAYITPTRVTVPSTMSGTVTSYSGADFSFIARTTEGVDVSSAFLLSLATGGNPDGLTYTIDNGVDPPTVTVTGGLGVGEAPGELTIDATGSGDYDGMIFQRTFTIDTDPTAGMIAQLLTANDQNGLTPPGTGQSITGVTLETTHPDGTVTYKATFNWTYDSDPDADNNFDAILWMLAVNTTSTPVTLGGPDAPTTNERGGVLWIDVTGLSYTTRIIEQVDPTKWYTFGFAKWRKVASATDPSGYIMGPITQYGPFQPSSGQNFTGNVGGTGATTIATATGNFNNRGERNSATVTDPTVAGDGTAIDHVLQFNSSVDVSFEWSWGGTEADIDGFEVMSYSSNSTFAYSIGSSPAAEQRIKIPRNMRAAILFGVEPTNYYTFYVRAYRKVDKDIDSSGYKYSNWVKSTASGENPYQPASSQAYYGNVLGTVNGTSASNVASWSSYANNGLNSDGTVKSGKVDTSAIASSSVTNSTEGKYTGFSVLSAPDTTNLYCIMEMALTTHGLPVHVFAEAINFMYTTTNATAGDEFAIKFILTRSLASNAIVSMQDGGSLTTYASHISGGAVALTPDVSSRVYRHYGADATIYQGAQLAKIGAIDSSPPGSVSSGVACVYGLWWGKVASSYGAYVASIENRIAMALLETLR